MAQAKKITTWAKWYAARDAALEADDLSPIPPFPLPARVRPWNRDPASAKAWLAVVGRILVGLDDPGGALGRFLAFGLPDKLQAAHDDLLVRPAAIVAKGGRGNAEDVRAASGKVTEEMQVRFGWALLCYREEMVAEWSGRRGRHFWKIRRVLDHAAKVGLRAFERLAAERDPVAWGLPFGASGRTVRTGARLLAWLGREAASGMVGRLALGEGYALVPCSNGESCQSRVMDRIEQLIRTPLGARGRPAGPCYTCRLSAGAVEYRRKEARGYPDPMDQRRPPRLRRRVKRKLHDIRLDSLAAGRAEPDSPVVEARDAALLVEASRGRPRKLPTLAALRPLVDGLYRDVLRRPLLVDFTRAALGARTLRPPSEDAERVCEALDACARKANLPTGEASDGDAEREDPGPDLRDAVEVAYSSPALRPPFLEFIRTALALPGLSFKSEQDQGVVGTIDDRGRRAGLLAAPA